MSSFWRRGSKARPSVRALPNLVSDADRLARPRSLRHRALGARGARRCGRCGRCGRRQAGSASAASPRLATDLEGDCKTLPNEKAANRTAMPPCRHAAMPPCLANTLHLLRRGSRSDDGLAETSTPNLPSLTLGRKLVPLCAFRKRGWPLCAIPQKRP